MNAGRQNDAGVLTMCEELIIQGRVRLSKSGHPTTEVRVIGEFESGGKRYKFNRMIRVVLREIVTPTAEVRESDE